MSTPFKNIYQRAISSIDDPYITATYQSSYINFYKTMYNYLSNAIPQYNSPLTMKAKLAAKTSPSGVLELFVGDGATKTFTFSTTPVAGSEVMVKIDNEIIADTQYTYNSGNKTFTFDTAPELSAEILAEWYFVGEFTETLNDTEELILAMWLVVCWMEKEKNFLLDIRMLLSDSDFRRYSEANSLKAKNDWWMNGRAVVSRLMNQDAWNKKISGDA